MVQLADRAESEGIVSSGIDWITVTGKTSDSRLQLGVISRRAARKLSDAGNVVLPWGWSGYEGFKTRGLQWGEREDSTCVRLSSDSAQEYWWDVYQVSEKVTRVDWQVTYRFKSDPKKRVLDHAKQARAFWGSRKDGPTITVVADSNDGATLYLGRRSSRVYFRCYNKEAESKEARFKNCVRYEVEFKDIAARTTMARLTDGRMVQAAVISQVHTMFSERGVSPPWQPDCDPLKIQWPKRCNRYQPKAVVAEESSTRDRSTRVGPQRYRGSP